MTGGITEAGTQPSGGLQVLSWRFEFDRYALTRQFVNALAMASERFDFYPNVSFGTRFASVQIDEAGQKLLGNRMSDFVGELETLGAQNEEQSGGTARP